MITKKSTLNIQSAPVNYTCSNLAKHLDRQVFDVLGKLFRDISLRKLLVDAVRYSNDYLIVGTVERDGHHSKAQEIAKEILEIGEFAAFVSQYAGVYCARCD